MHFIEVVNLIFVADTNPTSALLKRLTVSKSSPEPSPVMPRRPASTDNILSLNEKKPNPASIASAQSSPNIAPSDEVSVETEPPPGDAVIDPAAMMVSFSANALSDDENDITTADVSHERTHDVIDPTDNAIPEVLSPDDITEGKGTSKISVDTQPPQDSELLIDLSAN